MPSFWSSLVPWREVLLRNGLPALVAPVIWMTLVSFVLGQPWIRQLAYVAVGPLGGLVAALAAWAWVLRGRRAGYTRGGFALMTLALTLVAALACLPFQGLFEAVAPGLVGPVDLLAIGGLASLFTAGLYALRSSRAGRTAT